MKTKTLFSLLKIDFLKQKVLFGVGVFGLIGMISLGFAITYYDQAITGTSGIAHTWGTFSPDGNAGTISFDGPANVTLINDGTQAYLSGWLWLETVGWAHFDPNIGALTQLKFGTATGNIRAINKFSGWFWSENAGWIQMDPPGGGVEFDTTDGPVLNGWAYSTNLGWLQFGNGIINKDVGNGLIGKVKVIGNLSGNKIFDVLYNVGTSFAGQNTATNLNTIKKNIALLTRQFPLNTIAERRPKNNLLYYKQNGSIEYSKINTINDYFSKSTRTLIIEGADLIIDGDVLVSAGINDIKGPKSIIVLADQDGKGGNIIIKGNVKNIYATLVAEKSILSGATPDLLYNDTKENVLSALPPNQLYIKGSVISYNTIGGSSNDASLTDVSAFRCPWFHEGECNGLTALKYDFNYFRNFQGSSVYRGYPTDTYDDYSVIIEFDPRALSDPPPGLQF